MSRWTGIIPTKNFLWSNRHSSWSLAERTQSHLKTPYMFLFSLFQIFKQEPSSRNSSPVPSSQSPPTSKIYQTPPPAMHVSTTRGCWIFWHTSVQVVEELISPTNKQKITYSWVIYTLGPRLIKKFNVLNDRFWENLELKQIFSRTFGKWWFSTWNSL